MKNSVIRNTIRIFEELKDRSKSPKGKGLGVLFYKLPILLSHHGLSVAFTLNPKTLFSNNIG